MSQSTVKNLLEMDFSRVNEITKQWTVKEQENFVVDLCSRKTNKSNRKVVLKKMSDKSVQIVSGTNKVLALKHFIPKLDEENKSRVLETIIEITWI